MASKKHLIQRIESHLPGVMAVDRLAARREIQRLLRAEIKSGSKADIEQRFKRLQKRLEASRRKRNRRLVNAPSLRFNEDLPIFAKKDEIIQSIVDHQVVVVSGETGSGKTTQLPKFCLAAGRGIDGVVGCTQPRRIAATTVAHRVAEELGQDLGSSVGYKIRFRDRTPKDVYIKFMTDGILLAETQNDRWLSAYDTIIVDEAHERSLNIDFILGILQTLLKKRDDLKLIITSATIDTEKFSMAFNDAPIVEVSGRLYPVEVQYFQPDKDRPENGELTHVDLAAGAAVRLLKQSRRGDILVFMPTEQDIRETCELIEGEQLPGVRVLPLFARLTATAQNRVFGRFSERKIIVATNVAETSITIPGIKYVIDSGLARIARYSPRTRTTSLPVTPVSKSSCDQRKGRCGRVQNGVCIRLFPEDDYHTRPQFTPPEILRANLAEVILRMISLKLGEVSEFPFIDRPDLKSIKDGFELLFELGAIKNKTKDQGKRQKAAGIKYSSRVVLTEKGVLMAKIPLDPRLSRMLIEAGKEGCIDEMAIIAAALSIQDPRERPVEKIQDADRMHAAFNDPHSDFVTLLNIWYRYHDRQMKVKSNNQMKRFCRENYLSYRRMREWHDIHRQIESILKEHGIGKFEVGSRKVEVGSGKPEAGMENSKYEAIHKCVLSGFLSNIAQKKEKNIFRAAKGREVMIFPGSGLFNKAKNWIVAAEMVETSRVFARTAANIDSNWLEDLGWDLCRRVYLNPHWERNRGEVVASEQVSLFGLIIIPERKKAYGKVNPEEATAIFIQCALVNGDVKKPFAFMEYNRQLVEEIKDIENRFRRRDLLIDEQGMIDFYQKRLPQIYDIRTLAKYLKQKGDDRFLRMTKEALLQYHPNDVELSKYPDRLDLDHHTLECSYCFDPGREKDGVTVKVPVDIAPSVSPETIDWVVPGFYAEKIETLIRGLPKPYRKKLVPIKNNVDVIVREMPKTQTALVSALGDFIFRRFGVDIPAAAWSNEALPDHLKMRVSITAPDGKEIRAGRNAAILQQGAASFQASDEFEAARKKWEKEGITCWDFGDLPDFVRASGNNETAWVAYPALQNTSSAKYVNLRLLRRQEEALAVHIKGVATLYSLHFSKDFKFLKRQLTLPAGKAFMTDYAGGAKSLVKQMHDVVLHELFARNIRTESAFYLHAESAAPKILSTGLDLRDKVIPVLTSTHDARGEIYRLLQVKRKESKVAHLLESLIEELGHLVPETFITLYDKERLTHLVRYVKAVTVRAQRASVDFEKEQSKSYELKRFKDGLDAMLRDLSPSVSDEKRKAIEEYFWMVEEYKVSVFAQELKTAIPISPKRLEKKLKQIGRMV
jgi:ATP-dependent helicase HrpA